MNRRRFIQHSAAFAAGASLAGLGCQTSESRSAQTTPAMSADPLYKISLAQWSLHNALFGNSLRSGWEAFGKALREDPSSLLRGELDPIDFARVAREEFDLDGIEYVNTFYFDKARDEDYLSQLKQRAEDHGVQSLIIMCDAEGDLGNADEAARMQAVENHHKWVDAAAFLGCHSIRVNAASDPTLSYEEQQKLAADGLRTLAEYAAPHDINVIVENHGGLSSNGAWLAGTIEMADHERVGTLPDFGNFRIQGEGETAEWYDRYQGVEELMPYAKAVSAKSHVFDENGNEARTDYMRMMKIVLDAGYRGWVGIEYEGQELGEYEGIRATKALLEGVRSELAPEYEES